MKSLQTHFSFAFKLFMNSKVYMVKIKIKHLPLLLFLATFKTAIGRF